MSKNTNEIPSTPPPPCTEHSLSTAAAAADRDYPFECQVDIAFPTPIHANHTMQVLQVDQEIGNRIKKSFVILPDSPSTLRIHFQATEARWLRVSVSSFYDYLTVVLKCYQEFDDTLESTVVVAVDDDDEKHS